MAVMPLLLSLVLCVVFLLETLKESYGAVALLEKELDLKRVNKQIEEVDVFITTVTNHKATII